MSATTIQATINDVDMPVFQSLFSKYKIKTITLGKIDTQKKYPVEKSIPNEETRKAFEEMKENRHRLKGYTDVDLLINDMLTENE